MKYFSLILFGGLLAAIPSCQNDASANKAVNDSLAMVAVNDSANFTQVEWIGGTNQDIGKVKEGQVVEVAWKFRNTGNKPLVVGEVSAGCGCTVAERPEAPIAPNEVGVIKASFNSKGQGPSVRKSVTVRTNTNERVQYLTFSGEVER